MVFHYFGILCASLSCELGRRPTMTARFLQKRLLSLLVRNQTQPQTAFLKGASHCLYPSFKNPRNYTRYYWCVCECVLFFHDSLVLGTMMFFVFWLLGIMGLGELKTTCYVWISKKTEEIEKTSILKFWRLCTFFVELECCCKVLNWNDEGNRGNWINGVIPEGLWNWNYTGI